MSHSPFPWSEGESFVFDASGQAICREYSHNLNWKDDRALIAAIPEMVAALQDIMKHMDDNGMQNWLVAKKARAVLQKVRP